MKHLISLKEQSLEDLKQILDLATRIKNNQRLFSADLSGKTLIMLFQKTSTRTRLSFERAMAQLGGHSIFLDARSSQFSLTDFGDEIRATMLFGDILMLRAQKAADTIQASSYNQIPVIDGCSEKYHPCQALGDILTMVEYSGCLKEIGKIAWLGIENNVSNTLKLACAKLGIQMVLAVPEKDTDSIDEELNKIADSSGLITYTQNIDKALKNASFVHTDTWMNMEFFENGKIKSKFQKEYRRRVKIFLPFQLNTKIIEHYCPKAKIMHCMPCHAGFEISRSAIDHPNSIIFKQAENRLHIQKAILLWLLKN